MNKEFQFLIYNVPTEDVTVNAIIKDETIWLTQKAMAELFGVQTPAVNKHLKKIFDEGELDEKVVISKIEITTAQGAMPDKTKKQADQKAFQEYDEFNKTQKITSDFDMAVKRMLAKGGERN